MAQDEKPTGAAPASANASKPAKAPAPVASEPEPYDGRGGVYRMENGKRVRVEDPS